jgi:hypothetical protein
MRQGDVWESICVHCGRLASLDRRWQKERPTGNAPNNGTCCEAASDPGPGGIDQMLRPVRPARWEHFFVKPLGYMRQSGFSTSESDFVPHYNTAFGKRVRSLAEMKALQAKTGATDVVVKGHGLDRLAPRDVERKMKHHRETREAIDSGQSTFEPKGADGRPSGVKIEFSRAKEGDD